MVAVCRQMTLVKCACVTAFCGMLEEPLLAAVSRLRWAEDDPNGHRAGAHIPSLLPRRGGPLSLALLSLMQRPYRFVPTIKSKLTEDRLSFPRRFADAAHDLEHIA